MTGTWYDHKGKNFSLDESDVIPSHGSSSNKKEADEDGSQHENDTGTVKSAASCSDDTEVDVTYSKYTSVFDIHDDRPFVSDLLKKHFTTIEAVRANIQTDPLYDASRYDDVWILRFVLSNKSVKASTATALATMKFREQHKLNDMDDCQHRIPSHRDGSYLYPCHKIFYEHCEGNPMIHCLHDENRGVVVYFELLNVNLSTYATFIPKEDLITSRIMISEGIYRVLDEITRKTGRLTKVCRVMDMDGFPLKSFDKDYLNLESETASSIQEFYPQSASAILVVEAPRWCGWMWKIAKPLLPHRVRDKFDFVYPKRSIKDRKKFLRHVSLDHLPEKYGGKNSIWPPTRVRTTSNLLY